MTCAVFLDLNTSADAVLVDDELAQVAVAKRIGRSIFTRRVAAEGSEAQTFLAPVSSSWARSRSTPSMR